MPTPARVLLTIALLVACVGCAESCAEDVKELLADFKAAETAFYDQDFPADATDAERIARYKSYPRLAYLPRFLAIIEDDPSDDAALVASRWIVEQSNHQGSQWAPLFEADAIAWGLLEKRQLPAEEIDRLCWEAQARPSPAREQFLRETIARNNLPASAQANARAALAGLLAEQYHYAEMGDAWKWWQWPEDKYFEFLATRLDPKWIKYATSSDAQALRQESIELYHRVRDEYSDISSANATGYVGRDLATLGQHAEQRLYALENLFVGAEAPDAEGRDLDGKPLRLSAYRGKVVLLSFWFPTCGPCHEAVPEERELVQRFHDEPFALLGVCRESDADAAQESAADHGMTWPSWLDGTSGAICEAYSVEGFPRFYLLDAEGRIVSKDVPVGRLAEAVEAVLHPPADARP